MKKILVVDDAELNRELLYDILKDDYMIEMAANGEEALEHLRKSHHEISALLLDLRMPKIDGFAVIKEMQQKGLIQQIPTLIISSEHAIEIENLCFQLATRGWGSRREKASWRRWPRNPQTWRCWISCCRG